MSTPEINKLKEKITNTRQRISDMKISLGVHQNKKAELLGTLKEDFNIAEPAQVDSRLALLDEQIAKLTVAIENSFSEIDVILGDENANTETR